MAFPTGGLIPQPYHHMMLINAPRMAAFRGAIARTVRPGDRVLEAGAGTGVLSMLAARAGAAHVWAVEHNPDLAALARRAVARNGLADRVTVVDGAAEAFVPPAPIDVVICEMLHVALANEPQVPVMRALLANLAAHQDAAGLRILPFAVVSAAQLMEVDYGYEGFDIPLIRSCNPYVEDPRLVPVSDPATYWVCHMHDPEPAIDMVVPLTAGRPARVNAIQLITKAVLTPDFAAPANDWYLFQLQLPIAPREVAAGEQVAVRLTYAAAAPVEAIGVGWAATGHPDVRSP